MRRALGAVIALARRTVGVAPGAARSQSHSETAEAGRAAALLAFAGLFTGLGNLAFNVFVAHVLGADGYGAYAALLTLATIAGMFATATNYTVARRVARADNLAPAVIRRSLTSSWPWLVLAAGLLAFSPELRNFLHLRSGSAVLAGTLLFTVVVAAAGPTGMLIGLRRFRALAGLNIVGALARLAALPLVTHGTSGAALALVVSAVPSLIVGPCALSLVLAARRRANAWQTARAGGDDDGRLSIETVTAALLAALLSSLWSVPPILARHALSGSAAGAFSAAQLLAGSLLYLSAPMVTAFLPLTARGRSAGAAMRGLAGLLSVCAIGGTFLSFTGPALMSVLYGRGYPATSGLFVALAISASLVAAANFCAWMARAMRRLVWVAFAGTAAAAVWEVAAGTLLHPSPIGLALLPASATDLGLIVVTLALPEAAYATAVGAVRKAVAAALGNLRGRVARVTAARRLAVAVGIGGLVSLGIAGEDSAVASTAGYVALVGLVCATVLAFWASRMEPSPWAVERGQTRSWLLPLLVVGLAGLVASQTWFHAGTSIAGGDTAPPGGTAWLARLFSPWSWTGSDLGSPAANQRELPWALVFGAVHALGGSAGLAQRVWLTLLFTGMGAAAVVLLRTIGLRPLAATLGGLVYLFNPESLLDVPNDVYMLALVLFPLLPAIVLAAARGAIRVRSAVALMMLTAPLVGYVSQQPALLLAVAVTTAFCPPLVAWLAGRQAFWRALRAVGFGTLALAAASAYWLVPTLIRVSSLAVGQLASDTSWTQFEVRTTIPNGFWLNMTWGWNQPQYYPFAPGYEQQPLLLLKYLLPVLAFAALAVPVTLARRRPTRPSQLRIASAGAAAALFIIAFSTGTGLPGSLIFNPLSALPFGFLLREPAEHFLGLAAVAYAVLIGVAVDHLAGTVLAVTARHIPRLMRVGALTAATVCFGLASSAPAYPLLTGAVIVDSSPTLPPKHVTVPAYWNDMASYLNALKEPGDVLALPADHFYQVDYSWGYYGADSFIPNLVSRRVVLPLPQGYSAASVHLLSVVQEVDEAIVAGRWGEVSELAAALQTPLVLVRGDVRPSYLGPTDTPEPSQLEARLSTAPGVTMLRRSGPLTLYRVTAPSVDLIATGNFATVDSTQPDLRVLPYLPMGARLVSAPPLPGVTSVAQLTDLTTWHLFHNELQVSIPESPDRHYQLVWLAGSLQSAVSLTQRSQFIDISVPTTNALSGDAFEKSPWQPASDCAPPNGSAVPQLTATVKARGGPRGSPALQLAALSGSACEQRHLDWPGGVLVLEMYVRHLSGAPPRFCIFEAGLNKCASATLLPSERNWARYKAVITPDVGAQSLSLWLYSDSSSHNVDPTVNQYADIQASVVPSQATSIDVLGLPDSRSSRADALVAQAEGYNPGWSPSTPTLHVLVDGLTNGWITSTPSRVMRTLRYRPSLIVTLANLTSISAAFIACAFLIPNVRRLVRRRRLGQ